MSERNSFGRCGFLSFSPRVFFAKLLDGAELESNVDFGYRISSRQQVGFLGVCHGVQMCGVVGVLLDSELCQYYIAWVHAAKYHILRICWIHVAKRL